MEKQRDDVFTFTWVVENFSMCHESTGEFFYSPDFALNSLPGMKWYIRLYPRDFTKENCTVISLFRDDNILENCKVSYRFQIVDCKGKSVFDSREQIYVFTKLTSVAGLRVEKSCLFQALKSDILTIKCVLKPVIEANEQGTLPPLPYTSGMYTDVVLRAECEVFKVQKAILWARWPKMTEKFETKQTSEEVLGVKSEVLDAIIKYAYTGKIDFKGYEFLIQLPEAATKCEMPTLKFIGYEFLTELSDAAAKYEFLTLISMPVVGQKCRTHVDMQRISFQWPIENFSILPVNTTLNSNVFAVNNVKSCKWKLVFCLREDTKSSRKFDITLCKVYCNKMERVFVRCKLSFDKSDSSANERLFEFDDSWKCAEFSRRISKDPKDMLLIKCDLRFSNCGHFSEIVESFCDVTSSINSHRFSSDLRNLYRSGHLSDVNIVVDSEIFPAHKFILCARSSVFSRMFRNEMKDSEKNSIEISDMDPEILDEMLLFLYSGNLDKPLRETAAQLYVAAERYDLPALKRKCSSFLKCNLNVQNARKALQLADLYFDSDLYESVFEYISTHAEEVF
ncbi:speckle-type POZ protein-like [Stegodyphus dumicola]|uniref:speckle-type POZ protein-like n=1 Tax=Stegodyphus dumicola TaxID=202533 RepID=UPI0015A88654|nr:speckle-type POZ protein-like [Stegodyphus dumicola]